MSKLITDDGPLHDFLTHCRSWRALLERARDHAPSKDDEAYCTHELEAYDKAFKTLHAYEIPNGDIVTLEKGTIQERTEALIRDAGEQGIVVTIALQSVAPLRMGGYVMVPDFRPVREES